MADILGSIWWLIVTLGLLVTFHEFGHFWVARRLGVKVLRFSIGFGRPLWQRVGKDGTEYVLAAIPLGGYVRMLDEREGDVPAALLDQSFNRKSVWTRMAIVAAGPLANIVFTVAAFWAMFVIGKPDFLPILDAPTKLAADAGFRAGDRLLAFDDERVGTSGEATLALVEAVIERRDVSVRVAAEDGSERTIDLPLSRLAQGLSEREALPEVGLRWRSSRKPPEVTAVESGMPAANAGILPGDLIEAVNSRETPHSTALQEAIASEAAENPDLSLRVRRGGELLTLALRAELDQSDGRKRYRIGIALPDPRDTVLRHGPLAAVPAAFAETWRTTTKTLEFLAHMVVGRASLENVAGPIGIARTANASAQFGLTWFINFLAILSLGIAILNLLPIPILDGGHLLYYLIELVKGSPVSENAMAAGQYVGLVLLAGLMGLAFYNDILGLVS
jgi:regulator of sigma E protease